MNLHSLNNSPTNHEYKSLKIRSIQMQYYSWKKLYKAYQKNIVDYISQYNINKQQITSITKNLKWYFTAWEHKAMCNSCTLVNSKLLIAIFIEKNQKNGLSNLISFYISKAIWYAAFYNCCNIDRWSNIVLLPLDVFK